MSLSWFDATRPGIGYEGTMPGRSDITDGESSSINEAGFAVGALREQLENTTSKVNNVGVVVDTYGPQITDLIENRVLPWAVPTISPLSQTINRRADATVQLSELSSPVLYGTTDAAGHNHTHTMSMESSRMFKSGALKGQIYIAFLTPAITREYEQLNFMLGEGTTTPAQLDIAVYLVDTDTRVLSRQVHVTSVAAGLPIGESVVTVGFDKWVAVQGSYVAVAFLWSGTGDTRHILGVGETQRPLPTEIIFPAKRSARHVNVAHTVLPSSIDGTTQVDFVNWYTPYAELSENIGQVLRTFTESWPDLGSDVGRPWVALTAVGIGSFGGYTAASGSGLRVSIYDTPLATDRVRVSSSIYRDQSTIDNRRSTLVVRGTNNLRSGIGLSAISRSRYELITWSNLEVASDGEWDDRTVVATIPRVPQQGDQLEVDYLDGLVSVRINGDEYVSSVAIPGHQGPAARFVGIQNRRQAFITASYSPWFGPWSARDLPPVDPGGDNGAGEIQP